MSFASDFDSFTARLRRFFRAACSESMPIEQDLKSDADFRVSCENDFNSLALELFGLQFKYNEPYRKFCEGRRLVPQMVEHWAEIPTLPTAAFKECELSCLPLAQRTAVFHSSGTTEHRPSRHFHNSESLAIYEESLWTWFPQKQKADAPKQNLLILTPPPNQAPHSSLVHMYETIRQKLGPAQVAYAGQVDHMGSWVLDSEMAIRFLSEIKNGNQAVLVLGTAFSYVHLLDTLAERGVRFELPAGSQTMETGGYKGRSRELPKAQLHELITFRLGIQRSHILCEYGMSELGSQAYQSWIEQIFRFPPWARVQVVSPETGQEVAEGETGVIRVFDLANVFSVTAVQTEDLGVRRANGFELVGRSTLAEARGCSLMPA